MNNAVFPLTSHHKNTGKRNSNSINYRHGIPITNNYRSTDFAIFACRWIGAKTLYTLVHFVQCIQCFCSKPSMFIVYFRYFSH